MKKAKLKMQNAEKHMPFFILHFAFLILPFHLRSLTLALIVNAQNESTPLNEHLTNAPTDFGQLSVGQSTTAATIDPNNPPWGIAAGILTWVASVALLFAMGLIIVLPYVFTHAPRGDEEKIRQFLVTDQTAVFLQVLSVVPAHLLTLFIVWAVVTRFGKRPFWKTLGWSWGENFGFWKTAAVAVGLLVIGYAIGNLVKGKPTDIDQIVANSLHSRYMLAFAAGVTAPFIEELVYRGVLYSALRKTINTVAAVIIVTILFAGVHVLEYRNNIGVILAVSILSLGLTMLRAFSGRLLPCFIVHLIFNGIQAIYIVIEPYLKSAPEIEQKAPAIAMLWRTFRPFFF
jgi:membrane protease YdiL (CAAX protease family)